MPLAKHPPLQLVQRSAWNGFRYDFLDAAGQPIGHFEFPNFAQARNARLQVHPKGSTAGDIRLVLEGEHRVDFEYLSRGWVNDLRYRLLRGDVVLAHMHIRQMRGRRWPEISLHGPIEAHLLRAGHWWRRAFELHEVASGQPVTRMQEQAALTLKRRYDIVGASLSAPVKGLLAVVVTSLRL